MAINDEWVEDVRRWCATGSLNAGNRMPLAAAADELEAADIGYEAAQPSLQQFHAFDVAGSMVVDLR